MKSSVRAVSVPFAFLSPKLAGTCLAHIRASINIYLLADDRGKQRREREGAPEPTGCVSRAAYASPTCGQLLRRARRQHQMADKLCGFLVKFYAFLCFSVSLSLTSAALYFSGSKM